MRADEDQHANEASESGGEELKDYTKNSWAWLPRSWPQQALIFEDFFS